MKKRLGLFLLMGLLVGCNTVSSSSSVEEVYSGSYTIKITAIGSTTINVGDEVTLRTTVTGTINKDVTWSSLNPSIADVSDKGVVTGYAPGEVDIVASLNIEPLCKATAKISVNPPILPTSLQLTGYASDLVGWVDSSEQLSVTILPNDASKLVSWSSDDTEVATVNNGLVSFLKAGEVTISATSTVTPLSDAITYEVKEATFIANKAGTTGAWDVSHQGDVDGYVDLAVATRSLSDVLYFAHTGQVYYATATFRINGIQADQSWDWNGFGIGSALNDNDARAFRFAPDPAQANVNNKTILTDFPVTWGALTTRSQIWREHGLNELDCHSDIQISMIRYFNEYYYFLNGELFWYDNALKYDEIDTYPIIFSNDIPVRAFAYELIINEEEVYALTQTFEAQQIMFPTYRSYVNYVDSSEFTFNNMATLSKDSRVRSIGDKGRIIGDFEIEFDLDEFSFNTAPANHTGVGLMLQRYDSADTVDSISVGRGTLSTNDGDGAVRFQKW
ncbi:MAG: Ig-like domain-containing protein, partial [Bacillales bacterium]|nr:Ig-like domain-containing protein [Bacillales bacterium]